MIILLTGPTGSGKTDTSWALLQQVNPIVFLDCDWFASRTPFNWKNESDVETVFQGLSLMIDFHLKNGNENFVIPLTMEMAFLFNKYKSYFSKFNLEIHAFRLRCNEQELERRIRERDRNLMQKEEELRGMLEAQASFDHQFSNNQIFKLIDTTKLSEQAVAQEILLAITNPVRKVT